MVQKSKKRKREIKDKRWYVVDLRRKSSLGSYYVFKRNYKTQAEAKKAIKISIPDKYKIFFDTVRGDEAKQFNFKLLSSAKRLDLYGIIKYDYPPELETVQSRKSFRTKYRRWKRDYKKELTRAYATKT